jgi:hypothetical protein
MKWGRGRQFLPSIRFETPIISILLSKGKESYKWRNLSKSGTCEVSREEPVNETSSDTYVLVSVENSLII